MFHKALFPIKPGIELQMNPKTKLKERARHTSSHQTASGVLFALAHLRVSCKNTDCHLRQSTTMNALYTVYHRASGSLTLPRLAAPSEQGRTSTEQHGLREDRPV